jgi:hypothetical protein
MAAVHHPAVREKYALPHFISCESANTYCDLVTTVGLHLGLEPTPHLLKAIVQHFTRCGPCLVVLDNFETPWEPLEFRGKVEEFISLLTDIPTLALLVCSIFTFDRLLTHTDRACSGDNAWRRKTGKSQMESTIPPSS